MVVKDNFHYCMMCVALGFSFITLLQGPLIIYGMQTEKQPTLKRLDNGKFSVLIPDGWEEIPKSVLDEFSTNLKKIGNKENVPRYDFGFQLKSKDWLKFPYILIQVEEGPKITEKELNSINKLSDIINQLGADLEENYSSIISEVKYGEFVYDPKLNIIWWNLKIQFTTSQYSLGLAGLIPYESGSLKIYCYSWEKDFNTYSLLFEKFITNIKVSSEIEYKSESMFENIFGEKFITNVIAYSIIGAIIGLFSYFRRKKSKRIS